MHSLDDKTSQISLICIVKQSQCLVIVNSKIWSFAAVFRIFLCYGPRVVIVIAPRGIVLVVYVM